MAPSDEAYSVGGWRSLWLPLTRELPAWPGEGEKPAGVSLRHTTQYRPRADSIPTNPAYPRYMKDYDRANTAMARMLRRNMTPWERKLWHEYLKTYPIRWQRQKPIGRFIVDFYCAKARLVVELDGGGHYEQQQQNEDLQRTQELEHEGLMVIRFSNLEVDRMFLEVCTRIDQVVRQRVA